MFSVVLNATIDEYGLSQSSGRALHPRSKRGEILKSGLKSIQQ